jgi:hypothetical protein
MRLQPTNSLGFDGLRCVTRDTEQIRSRHPKKYAHSASDDLVRFPIAKFVAVCWGRMMKLLDSAMGLYSMMLSIYWPTHVFLLIMAVGQMITCAVHVPGAVPLAMLIMAFGQLGLLCGFMFQGRCPLAMLIMAFGQSGRPLAKGAGLFQPMVSVHRFIRQRRNSS